MHIVAKVTHSSSQNGLEDTKNYLKVRVYGLHWR